MITLALEQLFGNVRQVITTDSTREELCSLPFFAVQLWAELDQLTADSENTVALLITHWYEEQDDHPPEEQFVALSGLIRLEQLTPSFLLQMLDKLE